MPDTRQRGLVRGHIPHTYQHAYCGVRVHSLEKIKPLQNKCNSIIRAEDIRGIVWARKIVFLRNIEHDDTLIKLTLKK